MSPSAWHKSPETKADSITLSSVRRPSGSRQGSRREAAERYFKQAASNQRASAESSWESRDHLIQGQHV